jgi:hypothetical protein
MKKITLAVTLVSLSTALFALDINVEAGDAFNKVMAKNRASKKMEGSNYVQIKNSDQLQELGDKDLGVTIDADKKIGTVYNYVEVSNAKVKKKKFTKSKDKTVNKYGNKDADDKAKNIGVKIKTKKGFNRGFKGKVLNSVKIENSELD